MKLLAIETSTPWGGVAVMDGMRLAGESLIHGPKAHSRECLLAAEALLADLGLKWNDLGAVAATHGPGSFTGVRVGLTLVKGLAWSLGVPCVSVSTTEALARGAWNGEAVDVVVPLLDARVNEVYGAVFARLGDTLRRLRDDFCAAPAEIAALLDERRALFAGEGARRYFDAHLAGHGELARPERLQLSAAAVARIAAEKVEQGETVAPEALAARYLREATTTRPPIT